MGRMWSIYVELVLDHECEYGADVHSSIPFQPPLLQYRKRANGREIELPASSTFKFIQQELNPQWEHKLASARHQQKDQHPTKNEVSTSVSTTLLITPYSRYRDGKVAVKCFLAVNFKTRSHSTDVLSEGTKNSG
jgi:hypothetical protein